MPAGFTVHTVASVFSQDFISQSFISLLHFYSRMRGDLLLIGGNKSRTVK